jgi:hypothetical protein
MSSVGKGEIEVEDEPELAAIREALWGTILRVSQYSDNGIFSDIDSFVELSQGNTSINEVDFYSYDKEGDDELWEKMGNGLANLKSLERFNIRFGEESFEEETNAVERPFRIDFDRTLAIVLLYMWQNLIVDIFCDDDFDALLPPGELKALTRAIRRHPTIKEFDTTSCFLPVARFNIILSALATLPSLMVAKLKYDASSGSRFKHPEALKKLMLSPSLRKIYFDTFTFCKPLCVSLDEALREGSNVALLFLENYCVQYDGMD